MPLNPYDMSNTGTIWQRVRRLERGEQRYRRGRLVPASGDQTRVSSDGVTDTGQVGITGTEKRGSAVLRVLDGKFTYVATDTSITWYWDGTNGSRRLILLRIDETQLVIPAGSLTVLGLASSTKFFFMPFWAVNSDCGIGWVLGNSGRPKIAHTVVSAEDLRLWTLEVREPLADEPLAAQTNVAGVTTPSDPSGGGFFGGDGTGSGNGRNGEILF